MPVVRVSANPSASISYFGPPPPGVQESHISETMVVESTQQAPTPSAAAAAPASMYSSYSAWGLWEWISRPAAARAAAPAARPTAS